MRIRDVMSVPPVVVPSITSVREVASHMDHDGVGCVLIVDDDHLVGIITDRDLALRVVAPGLSPDVAVGSVMTPRPLSVGADEELATVVHLLGHHEVRRLPVMIGDIVIGIVTLDDLLVHVAGLQRDLLAPVAREITEPQHART
jgi:signal-transduction protein with cAMP-binding, CBS, and nucleotidyltransferase domain